MIYLDNYQLPPIPKLRNLITQTPFIIMAGDPFLSDPSKKRKRLNKLTSKTKRSKSSTQPQPQHLHPHHQDDDISSGSDSENGHANGTNENDHG